MAMTDYYYDDDDGDDDGNKDGNDKENDASGSESDDPIFDLITATWYHVGVSGNGGNGAAAMEHLICIVLKMFHKLLYAKFVILD